MPARMSTKLPTLLFSTIAYLGFLMTVASMPVVTKPRDLQSNPQLEVLSPSFPPSQTPTIVDNTTPTPSVQPTMQPSRSQPIVKATKFRQEFLIENGREFNQDDIIVFQALYQRDTDKYVPVSPSEVATKIETSCTIDRQIFLDRERVLKDDTTAHTIRLRGRHLQGTTSTSNRQILTVDYTMKFVSQHYNVTSYPKLFQNWTNSNLGKLLENMQLLNLNVTRAESAKRIIVSTQAPSAVPTMFPTMSHAPTSSLSDPPVDITPPSSAVLHAVTNEPVLPAVIDEPEPYGSNNNKIILSITAVLIVLIVAISVWFYEKKQGRNQRKVFNSNGSKSSRGHKQRDFECGGSEADDVNIVYFQDYTSSKEQQTSRVPGGFGTFETIAIE